MRVVLSSAIMFRGSHVDAGRELAVDDTTAQTWVARGWATPVAISSVRPPLAETEPPPAPDLGDDLAAVVESEPADEPVEPPTRRRRSR